MAPLREPISEFDIGSSKCNSRCLMLTVFDIDGVEMKIYIEKNVGNEKSLQHKR